MRVNNWYQLIVIFLLRACVTTKVLQVSEMGIFMLVNRKSKVYSNTHLDAQDFSYLELKQNLIDI